MSNESRLFRRSFRHKSGLWCAHLRLLRPHIPSRESKLTCNWPVLRSVLGLPCHLFRRSFWRKSELLWCAQLSSLPLATTTLLPPQRATSACYLCTHSEQGIENLGFSSASYLFLPPLATFLATSIHIPSRELMFRVQLSLLLSYYLSCYLSGHLSVLPFADIQGIKK